MEDADTTTFTKVSSKKQDDALETAKWKRYLPEAFGIREAVRKSSYRWCVRERLVFSFTVSSSELLLSIIGGIYLSIMSTIVYSALVSHPVIVYWDIQRNVGNCNCHSHEFVSTTSTSLYLWTNHKSYRH